MLPRLQRRRESLLHVRLEGRGVDRAVKDGRRREPPDPERGDDGVGLPMTARRVIPQPRAHRAATAPTQEIRGHATFVENT